MRLAAERLALRDHVNHLAEMKALACLRWGKYRVALVVKQYHTEISGLLKEPEQILHDPQVQNLCERYSYHGFKPANGILIVAYLD